MVQSIPPTKHGSITPLQEAFALKHNAPRMEYMTTLSSVKGSALSNYFWKGYNYVSAFFAVVAEWVMWVVTLGRSSSTKIEIIEQIIADPERLAEEFAQKPEECMTELIAACLLDPVAVKKLRDENEAKVGDFIRAFKKALPEDKKHLITGITSSDKTFIKEKLIAFLQDKTPVLASALKSVSERVLDVIGDHDSDELDALRGLFKDYLPKVIEYAKKKPPVEFAPIVKEFAKCFTTGYQFNTSLLTAIPELNDQKGIDCLSACLRDNHLLLNKLSEPRLLHGFVKDERDKNAPGLSFQNVCIKEFITRLSSEDMRALEKTFTSDDLKPNFYNAIASELKEIFHSRTQKAFVGANVEDGWKLIKHFDQDLVHPPVKK